MKGRTHSVDKVLKSLFRKRIYFTETNLIHKSFGALRANTVILSNDSDNVGIGTYGKLDYLRKQGWSIIDYRTQNHD